MGQLQIYNYYMKSGFEMVFSIRVDGLLDSTIILISTQMDFILILILTRYVIIFFVFNGTGISYININMHGTLNDSICTLIYMTNVLKY